MDMSDNTQVVKTVKGIDLRQSHIDRILDGNGWLTSQIIDVRVKQLQQAFPHNLYFDTSFFGFLCPTRDRDDSFTVDYPRVRGWTKPERLPGECRSLFDLERLFIPINQGDIHWVLVVVDLAARTVAFYDSFQKDGTVFVEAVQEYLVKELSARDKHRDCNFRLVARTPSSAPVQYNGSDCGVLVLHYMEELSDKPQSEALTRALSQTEIDELRIKIVEKINS